MNTKCPNNNYQLQSQNLVRPKKLFLHLSTTKHPFMKNTLFLFCLLLISACSTNTTESSSDNNAAATTSTTGKKAAVQNINVEQFDEMDGQFGVFVLDVRTPNEINEGKIRGAIDLDISDPAFSSHLSKMDKNKSYVVYCKSGGRSATATNMMVEMGFQKVYNLEGGYKAWKNSHPNVN